jgi:hypothetical protein
MHEPSVASHLAADGDEHTRGGVLRGFCVKMGGENHI